MTSSLELVRARFREVHGDHPMSPDDDAAVRVAMEPLADESVLAHVAAGRLPLPAYLLSDGTPMVPPGFLHPVEWAGGIERLHEWFVHYWEPDEQATAEQAWGDWLAGRYFWLAPATPYTIRKAARLLDQARWAVARLTEHPRDPVGRGSLDEAADGLERLLGPDTGYDRLRSGGATVRDTWVDGVRRGHLAVAPPQLPIRTERLLLRDHRPEDVADVFAYYGRDDVATYLLYDAWSRADFDDRFRQWDSGEGKTFGFVIEHDGRVVGDVVLMFRGASQAELGWVIHPGVGGRGFATEATRVLLDLAFDHYGFHRVYAELDARNTASARLCERLGMRREALRLRDYWSKGEWTDTLQYAVLAEEWPPRAARGPEEEN